LEINTAAAFNVVGIAEAWRNEKSFIVLSSSRAQSNELTGVLNWLNVFGDKLIEGAQQRQQLAQQQQQQPIPPLQLQSFENGTIRFALVPVMKCIAIVRC
jgi:hypothetical protein